MTDNAAIARRVLSLLDLTELGDHATDDDVRRLCERAIAPDGLVAAVCVWPRFVSLARSELSGSGVRVATVTNFPSGAEALADVVAATEQALEDGTDEIDVVLPYRQLASGDVAAAESCIETVRRAVPRDGTHLLKVILETGELASPAAIDAAARLAIRGGADFVKTSTGKTAISATLAATEVMLGVIKDMDPSIGLKPSGGIRTLADAQEYLDQADGLMGPSWVGSRTFRFGASGLLDALIAELRGEDATTGNGTPASY